MALYRVHVNTLSITSQRGTIDVEADSAEAAEAKVDEAGMSMDIDWGKVDSDELTSVETGHGYPTEAL